MASLDDVLSAIISQFSQGRGKADAASISLARLYLQEPLLRHFPVPKMILDEAEVDLKFAVGSITAVGDMTSSLAVQLVDLLRPCISELPRISSVFNKHKGLATFIALWPDVVDESLQNILVGLKSRATITPEWVASRVTSIVANHFRSAVRSPDSRIPGPVQSIMLASEKALTDELKPQLQAVVTRFIEEEEIGKPQIKVMVTASELQSIPADRLTTIRLSLREADQMLIKSEDSDAETEGDEMDNVKFVPA